MRITHWVNALVLLVLLMSGLQIFNAHPALYIGAKSDFSDPIMAMGPVQEGDSVKGCSAGNSTPPACSDSRVMRTLAIRTAAFLGR